MIPSEAQRLLRAPLPEPRAWYLLRLERLLETKGRRWVEEYRGLLIEQAWWIAKL